MCQTQYFLSQLVQNATDTKSVHARTTEIDWGYYEGQDLPGHINFTVEFDDAAVEGDVNWVDDTILVNQMQQLDSQSLQDYIVRWVWKAEPIGLNFFFNANRMAFDTSEELAPIRGRLKEAECPETDAPTHAPTISLAPTDAPTTTPNPTTASEGENNNNNPNPPNAGGGSNAGSGWPNDGDQEDWPSVGGGPNGGIGGPNDGGLGQLSNGDQGDWPFGPNYSDLSELKPMAHFSLNFAFFEDHEVPPTLAEVNALICQVNSYFTQELRRGLSAGNIHVKAVYVDYFFDEGGKGSSAEDVRVNFTAFSYYGEDEHDQVAAQDVVEAMKLDYLELKDFVEQYVWKSEPEKENLFYHTESLDLVEGEMGIEIHPAPAMIVEASGCVLPRDDDGSPFDGIAGPGSSGGSGPGGPIAGNPSTGLGGDAKQTEIAVNFRVSNLESIVEENAIKASGLDSSFPVFTNEMVSELTQRDSVKRTRILHKNGRLLRVVPIPGTSTIYQVDLYPCPDAALPGLTCHSVRAKYDVLMSSDEDTAQVQNTYTDASEEAVNDGTYNTVLQRVDPETPLYIGIMTKKSQIPPGSIRRGYDGEADIEDEPHQDHAIDGSQNSTLWEVLENMTEFSTLVDLLKESDLANDPRLTDQPEIGATLVAPTNSAFEELDNVLPDPKDVLLYHIIEHNLSIEDVRSTDSHQLLVETGHPYAQMLVTLNKDDTLTFNGVECIHELFELDLPETDSNVPDGSDYGNEERYGIRAVHHEWTSEEVTLQYQLSDYILDDSIKYILYDGLGCRTDASDITQSNQYLFIDFSAPRDSEPNLANKGTGTRGPFELQFTVNKPNIETAPFFAKAESETSQLNFCLGLSVLYNYGDGEEVNAVETAIQISLDNSDFKRIENVALKTVIRPKYNRLRELAAGAQPSGPSRSAVGLMSRNEAQVNNRVVCSVETVLHPPTMVQMLQIASQNTDRGISIINELLDASISNDPFFWENIATEERVTFFALLDTFEGLESIQLRNRLMSAEWWPHLRHFLSSIIVGKALSIEDLEAQVNADSPTTLSSISGKEIAVSGSSIRGTLIDGRPIQGPSMSATDGIIHFVDYIELPKSVSHSVYDILVSESMASNLTKTLESADLQEKLSQAAPITCFAPPSSLLREFSAADAADAIESHIFEELYYTERLLNMDGQVIKSRNNKTWVVSVLDGSVFLEGEDDGSIIGQVQSKSQQLASNGVVHGIDALLFAGVPLSDWTLVPFNASFVISNLEGLTSIDISSFNAATLIEAFTTFVENLVAFVEQKQQQEERNLNVRSSPRRRRRRLDTMLHPDSVRIYGLQDISCPTSADTGNVPPEGSNCQRVYGSFVLATSEPNPRLVQSTYSVEARSAFRAGKLRDALLIVDPNSPIQVIGLVDKSSDNTSKGGAKTEDDQEMEWWQPVFYTILFLLGLVFICVVGYCGCLRGMIKIEPKKKDKSEDAAVVEPPLGRDTPIRSSLPKETISSGREEENQDQSVGHESNHINDDIQQDMNIASNNNNIHNDSSDESWTEDSDNFINHNPAAADNCDDEKEDWEEEDGQI